MDEQKKVRKPRATKPQPQPVFERLSTLNVNDKTEKRNSFTYLSWAFAWAEFKKQCPDANYEVIKDPVTHKPYMADEFGIMVQTRVTTQGETHEMWLPVMDNSNNAQKSASYQITFKSGKTITVAPASMMDINKALMRCLVKNLAMFGLGIYIYAGDDLPDGYVPPKPTIDSKRFDNALKAIENGTYYENKLRETFALTDAQNETLNEFLSALSAHADEIKKSINN